MGMDAAGLWNTIVLQIKPTGSVLFFYVENSQETVLLSVILRLTPFNFKLDNGKINGL
jgi:hypothetical protein